MKTLREQVKECPELGELLSDYEQRISLLENSTSIFPPRPDPTTDYIIGTDPAVPEHRLMKELQEVKGIAYYAKQKIQEHTSSSKKKRFTTYD